MSVLSSSISSANNRFKDFLSLVIAIYQFDPDPHFQFLCEHGARRHSKSIFRKYPSIKRVKKKKRCHGPCLHLVKISPKKTHLKRVIIMLKIGTITLKSNSNRSKHFIYFRLTPIYQLSNFICRGIITLGRHNSF